jgi:hypothetical protein
MHRRQPVDGRIVAIYGDGLRAGQNQVVAINRGKRRRHGTRPCAGAVARRQPAVDTTGAKKTTMRLPDERHGVLFVFRVFERVSYALIVNVQDPVRAGDRFTQP